MSINPDSFNTDPLLTKSVTNKEADGLSLGDNPTTYAISEIPSFEVSVSEGRVHASDVTKTYTGPGSGTAQGYASPTDVVGHITSTGSKMTITGTAGAETIELIHHSGALIQIDADGSIFLMPTSRKGFGLHAGKGDGLVSSQGRLVIKGTASITLETEGSMEFNVGKNLFMDVGGDYLLSVKGTTTISSDGAMTTEVAKDKMDMIGGVHRVTVAGDQRTQIAGDQRTDVGKGIDNRAELNITNDAQKSLISRARESVTLSSSQEFVNINAFEDVTVSAKENVRLIAKEDVTIDATDNAIFRSKNSMILGSDQSFYLDAADNIKMISGDQFRVDAGSSFDLYSSGTNIKTQGAANFHSSSATDIRGSIVDVQKGNPSTQTPQSPEITSNREPNDIEIPEAPEYPDANTVIDHMTTERLAPDFPFNAKKMSAEEMSRYENEGDTPNPEAKSQADGNQGAGSPYSQGSSAGSLSYSGNQGYDGSSNNTRGSENPYPAPSSFLNASDKLSRHVTIGMFGNLSMCPASQMGLSRKEILENARHLAYNILDPVLEQFGSRVQLNPAGAGLRIGNGTSRHYLGKAHDLRASSRDGAETAMIAKWIAENLPFDRLFLEANNYGSIHIHVEAAPPGTPGAKIVWTCQDPKCNSKIDGLNLAYAQQGLKKMGFA